MISARISMRSAASRLESGSSIRKTRGSRTMARPSATRCRWPPGQLLRPPLENAFDAQHLRGLAHAVLDLRLRHLSQAHAERDVREHVEMGEERVVLEHHRHVAVVRQLVGHVLAVEQHVSVGGDLEPGDDAHGGGLAAAGRPDEHDELAVRRRRARSPRPRRHRRSASIRGGAQLSPFELSPGNAPPGRSSPVSPPAFL